MTRLRPFVVGVVVACVLSAVPLLAQGPFAAQIEQFWQVISTGGRAFQMAAFSGGTTLVGSTANTLSLQNGTNAQTLRLYYNASTPAYSSLTAQSNGAILFNSNGVKSGAINVNEVDVLNVPVLTAAGSATLITPWGGGGINLAGTVQQSGNPILSTTAPVVASGFGSTSAGTVGTGSVPESTFVTVGTNVSGTTGVLTLPTAPNGWACMARDQTTPADTTGQTANTTTSATLTTITAWTTGDVLAVQCFPH